MTDRIFETGFDYVISNCDAWLPGSYDSRAAAQLALDNKSLQDWKFLEGLREDINIKQQRRITEEDIQLALSKLENESENN